MRKYVLKYRILVRSRLVVGVAILYLVWISVFAAFASEREVLSRGKQLYQRYCSVCHGDEGKGGGIMAEHLKLVRPADLTALTKKYGKPFPLWRMYRIIDGREEMLGHGPRDMPIWGNWFRIVEGMDEDAVRGRILQLIYYLNSIQEEFR